MCFISLSIVCSCAPRHDVVQSLFGSMVEWARQKGLSDDSEGNEK